MKPADMIPIAATLLGAIVSLYLALVSGDYLIAFVVGVALPAIVFLIFWLSNRQKKTLMWAALVVGLAMFGVAILIWWREQSRLDAYFAAIASGNRTYSDDKYPPFSMSVPTGKISSNHLSAFRRSKPTLAFLAAPAGAGKTVLLRQMIGESYLETETGTVYLPLSQIQQKLTDSRQPDTYGTQRGLGGVPTIDASNSEGAGFFTVICSSLFQLKNLSDQMAKEWPFSLRTPDANRRRFAEACTSRLETEAQSKLGLRIFIDDVDEIEEASLLQLMTLVDRAIQTKSASTGGSLLVLLAGRPEFFYTSSRERRWLWNESRNPDAGFSLLTGTIERATDTDKFEEYLQSCVDFTIREDEFVRDNDCVICQEVLTAINTQRQSQLSKNLKEALEYLDGCSFAARHFLRLKQDDKPFNDVIFAQDFYNAWCDRAYEKHRIPALDKVKDYQDMLKVAAAEIARGGGEAKLHLGLRGLLYSGLVDVIPVNFGSREYKVKFQFPQFQAAILQPPWEQKIQSPTRRRTGR